MLISTLKEWEPGDLAFNTLLQIQEKKKGYSDCLWTHLLHLMALLTVGNENKV